MRGSLGELSGLLLPQSHNHAARRESFLYRSAFSNPSAIIISKLQVWRVGTIVYLIIKKLLHHERSLVSQLCCDNLVANMPLSPLFSSVFNKNNITKWGWLWYWEGIRKNWIGGTLTIALINVTHKHLHPLSYNNLESWKCICVTDTSPLMCYIPAPAGPGYSLAASHRGWRIWETKAVLPRTADRQNFMPFIIV